MFGNLKVRKKSRVEVSLLVIAAITLALFFSTFSKIQTASAFVGNEAQINTFLMGWGNSSVYDIGYFNNGASSLTVATNDSGTRANVNINFEVWYGSARPAQYNYQALDTKVTIGGSSANKIVSGGPPSTVIHPAKNTGTLTSANHRVVYSGPYSTVLDTTGITLGQTIKACISFSSFTDRPNAAIQDPETWCQDIIFLKPWTASPSTSVDKTTASPGDTITWTHIAKNLGPNVSSSVIRVGGGSAAEGTKASRNVSVGLASGASSSVESKYIVSASDIGKTICRATTLGNYAWNQSGWTGWTDQKCVTIVRNYNLTPSVAIPADVIEPGSNTILNVTGGINNPGPGSGSPTASDPNGDWQLSRLVFTKTPSSAQSSINTSTATACSFDQYNANKKSCHMVKSGSWTSPININQNFTNGIEDNFTTSDEPVGTTVCYVLSIRPYAHNSGANWRHSRLECVTYGKKPKVQVWGGDLMIGRTMVGNTAKSSTSKIETGLSVKTLKRIENTTTVTDVAYGGSSAHDISGVWRTGVDNANNKIGANRNDPHWKIRTVYNDSGLSTCARGYYQNDVLGGPSPDPNIGNVDWQAVTVGELQDRLSGWPTSAYRGMTVGASGISASIAGDEVGATFGSPRYVWGYTRNDARWLGANVFAHDYSSSRCLSPTKNVGGSNMTDANTTVFALRNGINIDSSVDLSTVKFSSKLVADNLVKFFVNGKELKASDDGPLWGANWQEPGWSADSRAGVTGKALDGSDAFRHGNNTFEIHVKSTYTNTGLMVYDFGFSGKKMVTGTREVTEERTFGSWGEYALVSNGQIKNMASAAGFNHPDGASAKTQNSWSNITFANIFRVPAPVGAGCNATNIWGCYSYSNANMPNVASMFSTGTGLGTGTINTSVGSLTKGTVHLKTGGIINLAGGSLNAGEWIVINAPTATVNITGDIRYTNASLVNTRQIPQMVIIANNINIDASVGNVDSWLIAKNSLATCNAVGDAATLNVSSPSFNISSNDCGGLLRVNGPVMANKLWLRRTAGAGTGNNTGEPAEIFNYRPDAMLWLNNQLGTNSLRTTSVKELPPRF